MIESPPRVERLPPVRVSIRRAADRLAAAGVASPRHDAEELAAHLLGTTRVGLFGHEQLDAAAFERFSATYEDLVARRAAREPLQHITGVAYFRHLALAVGPGVFVPRPETEQLIDLVAAAAGPSTTAVDLCAGSGAIGLALACERPGTTVHLVEADPVAARWLRQNAAAPAPAVAAHVQVHEARVVDSLPTVTDIDLVVSNPPYLPTAPDDRLPPEVADYDPPLALWGGCDGLDVLREVVIAARRLLRPGGLLAVEHDARHQAEVTNLLRHRGFHGVMGHVDLTSQPRFVTGSLR